MNLDGQKCLVIGGAGFIGSYVVELLLQAGVREVVIFDNFTRGHRSNISEALEDDRCDIFPDGGDIRDYDVLTAAMRDCDVVFHLAAMWLLHCQEYPTTAFDVNIRGTLNVLNACRDSGVKRLVFSSSASVYGDAVTVPMTESHPMNSLNFYGATKISGEAMCTAYAERYGLSVVGLRYMNVYGARQDQLGVYTGVIPAVLNKIDSGEPPVINGDGMQCYDFIDVRDVAKANVLAAAEKNPFNRFYNVGSGKGTSLRELVELLLSLRGSSMTPVYRLYEEGDSRQLVKNRIGCPKQAYEQLGFKADISIVQGLSDLIIWRNSN